MQIADINMVTMPMGIAIHRIPNQPENPRVLVADVSNSRLVMIRIIMPLNTYWNSSPPPCGPYHHPTDIKTH